MRLHPGITHTDQALALQPVVGHSGLRGQRPRQVPVALAAEPGHDYLAFARPECQQFAHFGAHFTPLLPVAHAHPPAIPRVRSGTFDQDQQIVRVAGKSVTPFFQLCRSLALLPVSLAPDDSSPVRRDLVDQRSGCYPHDRRRQRQVGQISPNENVNSPCTAAAFILSPAPDGLRHLVLTRPGTEPSMRFLSVGSHVCVRASSRHPLTGLPLPSASSYRCPHRGHLRYSYRGLTPHQFMPMSGVHKANSADAQKTRAADLHRLYTKQ